VLNSQRWNKCAYVANNSLAFTDPDGVMSMKALSAFCVRLSCGTGPLLALLAVAFAQAPPATNWPKLVYATYLGAQFNSAFRALAVDSAGFVYVGATSQAPDGSSTCAFLTRLNQSGTAPTWTICLPFTQIDDLAVDSNRFLYVIGLNRSSTSRSSTIMKLTPDAHQVVYSTPIEGSGQRLRLAPLVVCTSLG